MSVPTGPQRDLAVERVARFMDLNYPCQCGDSDCPGNAPEAAEIVAIVDAARHLMWPGTVRLPDENERKQHHDCLFCGAYVNTECVRCGALIMSMTPGNDALNRCDDVCYRCDLEMSGLSA